MASFNKVFLLGNLTRDPELRTTQNGMAICKFNLACNRSYKAQDGSSKEEVTFVEVDCFGRQAELISKSLTKGSPIFVEGRLKLDQWESNTGEKRSKLSVVLETFQFIGTKRSSDESSFQSHAPYERPQPSSKNIKEEVSVNYGSQEEEDDIPF